MTRIDGYPVGPIVIPYTFGAVESGPGYFCRTLLPHGASATLIHALPSRALFVVCCVLRLCHGRGCCSPLLHSILLTL